MWPLKVTILRKKIDIWVRRKVCQDRKWLCEDRIQLKVRKDFLTARHDRGWPWG